MLKSKESQRVPQVTFHTRKNNEWVDINTDDIFHNKTVILFALPGAFTPTCSSSHLPRYNELTATFYEHNVDSIICLSVNDSFVMNAWAADQNAANITFLPDGNGDFSEGMGMLVNKSELGFGKRSWRYSMLVKNGIIEKMFIEDNTPGDPFKVSDADTMLNYIAPNAKKPTPITLISKPGCSHCTRARQALQKNDLAYEEIKLGSNSVSFSSLKAISGKGTTPQVYIDGEHIGGADELEIWLNKNN